ncbi:MAG: alpha/beta hydrolase [Flavobacteriaceae bacterium]|nr:alpha/beta hydrolase [Flavobacteriaceae bacterium]
MQKFKKGIYFLIILYVMIGASLYFFQEKLIFRPTTLPQDFTFSFSNPFEELFLKTEDGATINAIHFKTEKPKGIILYFHGNAGDLSRWGIITEFFVEKGYDVFVMDYRTYGKSKGVLSEQTLYSDSQMCYNYILKHYQESEIIVYGRSLGTGMATYLASNNNPVQLILETPFYSLTDVARDRFSLFTIKKLLRYDFPSYKYIKNISCPISIFHGTEDNVIPYASGLKLFNSMNQKKKMFFTIKKGGHNNLIEFEAYQAQIQNILP